MTMWQASWDTMETLKSCSAGAPAQRPTWAVWAILARLLAIWWHTYGKQTGEKCVHPGSPHAFLSHRGNGPLLEFKASRQLGSRKPGQSASACWALWARMCKPTLKPALLTWGKPRLELARKTQGWGRLAPGSLAEPAIIFYGMAYIMMMVSFLVSAFY
jgi:hypothetical protein